MELQNLNLLRMNCYIDGAWIDADDGTTFDIRNPATDALLACVPRCGSAETRRAIAAADAALPGWRALTAKQRARHLLDWFSLILASADDLARLMTAEGGKPLAEARNEVLYGA